MSVGRFASLQQNNWIFLGFKCFMAFKYVHQTITIGFEQNWIHFQGVTAAAMIRIMSVRLASARKNILRCG